MWNNLKFNKKVGLLALVFILFTAMIGYSYHNMTNKIKAIGIDSAKHEMLTGYKEELRHMVDIMANSLGSVSKGASEERLQAMYSKMVKDARFFPDKSGYFFIYKRGGEVFVHAAKPSLQGKNLYNLKDPNGRLLIQEVQTAALAGGGYVEYLWDKPGKGIQPKLSYARVIPGTQYWIGTGIYIDDLQTKEASILEKMSNVSSDFLMKLMGALAAILFLVILPLTLFMIKSMVGPLTNLTNIATEYSRGQLDSEFTDVDRQDEVGALSRAVQRLGRSTKIALDKLQQKA